MTHDTQASGSCCGSSSASAAPNVPAERNLLGGAADDMTVCPVMAGTPVSKAQAVAVGLFRDFEGERYYFCCAGCGPAFDAEPAKYAASMA